MRRTLSMPLDFVKFPELRDSQMAIYYFLSPHKQIFDDFTAKITKVIDGDTVKVKWIDRDFDFKIRLAGIAAKELSEGGGDSQKWLEDEVLGSEVDIKINRANRVGKWGRLIGRIFKDGLDINELSIRSGQSVPFAERTQGSLPDFEQQLIKIGKLKN